MAWYQNSSMCVTRHSAWRIGFDGVREMPEQREKTSPSYS
jgi:hypothetical protein